jgi:hypothetical protein
MILTRAQKNRCEISVPWACVCEHLAGECVDCWEECCKCNLSYLVIPPELLAAFEKENAEPTKD